MHFTTHAALVTLILSTVVSAAPTGAHRHNNDPSSPSYHSTGVHERSKNPYVHNVTFYPRHKDSKKNRNKNGNNENKGNSATVINDVNGGARVVEVVTITVTAGAPAPSSPSPPPSPPSPPAEVIAAAPEGGDGKLNAQDQAFLDLHNKFRAPRNADAMTWNQTLADAAEKQAKTCVFEHSGGKFGPFGENLASSSGSISPEQAIKMWGPDEEGDYDPSNPKPSHFTQVVWKGSKQVGCAIVTCPAGALFDTKFGESQYAVCEYFPPGNVIGQFPDNVTKNLGA